MILEDGGVLEGDEPAWHCLGCGQQMAVSEHACAPDGDEVKRAWRERYAYWSQVIDLKDQEAEHLPTD
jgi:hypothetical protein